MLSRAAHSFIHVDQGVDRDTLLERLDDREKGFHAYAIAHQESVTEDVFWPGGWTRHVSEEEARNCTRFRDGFVEPFGWFVSLDRKGGGEDHGPRRLAILFIGGDGFASYDALYCQGDGTPAPFLVVVQDHGFGGNYNRFGQGGLLELIAGRTDVRPNFLLVGENSGPWTGYADTGAAAEPGGSDANPRRLFCRVPQ